MPPIGVRPEFKTNGKAPEREFFSDTIFDVFQLGATPGCFFEDFSGFVNSTKMDTPLLNYEIISSLGDESISPSFFKRNIERLCCLRALFYIIAYNFFGLFTTYIIIRT